MRDHRAVSTLMSFAVAYVGIAGLFLTRLGAQTVRIEVYPLQVMTLTDEQVLTGVKDGTPALIAGKLRIPRRGLR
jgi:hypothetical protein